MSSTPTPQSAAPASPDARAPIAKLYVHYAVQLRRTIASTVNSSDTVVEDACAFAWLKLLEANPRPGAVFAWLRTVATREAWRLDKIERRTVDIDAVEPPAVHDPSGPVVAEVVHALAGVHPRRRELLLLHAAGFSTEELAVRFGITHKRARALVYQARLQAAQRAGRRE